MRFSIFFLKYEGIFYEVEVFPVSALWVSYCSQIQGEFHCPHMKKGFSRCRRGFPVSWCPQTYMGYSGVLDAFPVSLGFSCALRYMKGFFGALRHMGFSGALRHMKGFSDAHHRHRKGFSGALRHMKGFLLPSDIRRVFHYSQTYEGFLLSTHSMTSSLKSSPIICAKLSSNVRGELALMFPFFIPQPLSHRRRGVATNK